LHARPHTRTSIQGLPFLSPPDGSHRVDVPRDALNPLPASRPNDEPLFDVPHGLSQVLDRALAFAGLARIEERCGKEIVLKTDDRGSTIDVHALRHAFGTHPSKAGIQLRSAQAEMRHSGPSLTANVYTDPKLLDVAGAVASLPDLPVGGFGGSAAVGGWPVSGLARDPFDRGAPPLVDTEAGGVRHRQRIQCCAMGLPSSWRSSTRRLGILRPRLPAGVAQDHGLLDRNIARSAIWLFVISATLVFTLGAYAQLRLDPGWGLAFTEIVLIGLPAYLFLRRTPALIDRITFKRPRALRLLRLAFVAVCASVGTAALGTTVRRGLGLSAESLAPDLTIGPFSIVVLLFSLIVLAPLCEELLFRVAIQGSLSLALSPATTVFAASALFAVFHGAIERVPEVMILGLILSTLYRSTRSYWQGVFVHFILNTVGPPLFVAQSLLPTAILIMAAVVMIPLAVVALPRAAAQRMDSVGDGASGGPKRQMPRGILLAIALLVMGALGIETSLHVTRAFNRSDAAQFPAPGWCHQEWRLQSQGRFRVTERLTLAPGQSPPACIASIADGAQLVSAVVDSLPITPDRDGEGWVLASGATAGVRRFSLEWRVPIESLQLESGVYWIQTRSAVPISGLRVDLSLDPGCGYEDARDPARQRDPVLQMNTGAADYFTSFPRIGFTIRRVKGPER
jgi:membrane protease YdiL (CAAX protease family)